MSAASNRELVRRALELISSDLAAAGELFAPEFVRHLPGGTEHRGRASRTRPSGRTGGRRVLVCHQPPEPLDEVELGLPPLER